jgi:3-oxoacyl-[acyl-carrier-protein] synthase II
VFGEHSYNINLNSTKSMTGHLLGGTGAVEAIATILALREGIIPPTINHFEDDPQIDPKLDFTFNTARKRDIRYALSNAFGFGGQNTSLLFKKYTV